MGIWGQDWASYQDSQPDTTGLSFAVIKVTEGLGYVNPKWKSQRDTARSAGLVVGYYHYPHMANSDRAEANRFLSIATPQPGELVVLDWEGYDAANTHVSAADQLAYKEDFLQYVKSKMPHNPVGMYCNTDYWNRVDTTGHVGDFLWIATANRAAGDPGIRASWLLHQYGGDGDIDLDYCHLGSTAELRAWAMAFAQPPTPIEEDPLSNFTEADLRRFMREESLNSVISVQGRDTVAYAVCWWLQKALTGTPVPAVAGQPWGDLLPKLTAALGQLPPAALAQLQTAVQAALADGTVHVDVTVANNTTH